MAARPKRIRVTSTTDLNHILDEARAAPLVLVRGSEAFDLTAHSAEADELWTGYDAEQVRAAIAATAGSWAEGGDEIIANLYRARVEGSRSMTRP